MDQTGVPGQLEDACRRELLVDLHLEAGTCRTVRAELAGTHDDHQVLGTRVDRRPFRTHAARCAGGRRECGDGGRLRCIVGLLGRLGSRCGGRRERLEVGRGVEPAGEVGQHRSGGRGLSLLGGAERQQVGGHLLGAPGADTCGLDRVDHAVVVAHQSGAAHPADEGVGQRGLRTPRLLGRPAGHERVQGGLALAVGAVATEHAAVGGTRQDDVQAGRDVVVGVDLRQTGDETLDRPEQDLHLQLGASAGVGEVAGHPRGGEREQHRRLHGRLHHRRRAAEVLGLLRGHPLDQVVDVGVRRHVRRGDPQRGAGAGVLAVELLVEGEALGVQTRGGRDDGRTAGEESGDHTCGDGALAGTGDDGDLAAVDPLLGVLGGVRDRAEDAAVHGVSVREGLALPPGGVFGDGVPGAGEPADDLLEVGVELVLVGQPETDEILTGGCPPVVDEDDLGVVERRCDGARPVRSEFGADQFGQFGVGIGRGLGEVGDLAEAQLLQHGVRRRRERTRPTGDLFGELAESSRVDRCATAGFGRGLADRDALLGTHGGDRLVDQRIERVGVGDRAVEQVAQCLTADRGAVPGTQGERDGRVQSPAGAELPHGADAVGDVVLALAQRAEDLADLVADRIGEHRTQRTVAASEGLDGRRQRDHVSLRRTIDGTESELATDVEQQLVAA